MAKMIKDLPVGAKVKFGRSHFGTPSNAEVLKWKIVAKNHRGYPSNSVTLFNEYSVDIRVFDEPDGRFIRDSGSLKNNRGDNDYEHSNVDMWLNSNSSPGNWFNRNVSKVGRVSISTPDEDDSKTSGFLYNFTNDELSCLLETSINVRCTYSQSSYDIKRKFFLPSLTEVGLPTHDYNRKWWFFSSGYDWEGRPVEIQDAIVNKRIDSISRYRNLTDYPQRVREDDMGYFRDAIDIQDCEVEWRDADDRYQSEYCVIACACNQDGGFRYGEAWAKDRINVRPVTNIKDTTRVSNVTDSEGYYTIVFNTPPSKPTYLRKTAAKVFGGKILTMVWNVSTDDDGDVIKYVLQRKVNNGSWTTLSSTLRNTQYTDSITFGWNTVQYRVAAYDFDIPTDDASFTTSDIYSIINNVPPTISGSDKDLGTFSSTGASISYIITDADSDNVTVRTSVDNRDISNTRVILGTEYKINLTGDSWVSLRNGRHTVRIEATDSVGNVATRTYTFIKSVTQFIVGNKVPYPAKSMPGRIKVYVNRQIPTGADFRVLVCNNGFDTSPTWEDATQSVTTNLVHVFTNKSKTASQWGVKIKVIANRKNTSGECYISEIGGNFE